MAHTLIIGEMGSSHDGDLDKAFQCVRVAKETGVDILKGQFWSSADRLAARRNANEYVEVYRQYQVPQSWLAELKMACDEVGIEWATTCYLPEDILVIAPLVKRFKIASFEAGDRQFLEAHLPFGKPMLISTGLMDEERLFDLKRFRAVHDDVVSLLHCVAAYPTPADELNLHVMDELDGLSDHTGHVLTGALAAVRGAAFIEVHFRLDSTSPQNPDFGHSLTPPQLREYVQNVRLAERVLGDGVKRLMPSEKRWARYRVRPEGT